MLVRPVRPTAALPAPTTQSARLPDRLSARPHVLGPVHASSARLPVRSTICTLSAPVRPTVRGLSALSVRPLVRSSARPPCQRPSARPPVNSVHASSATSARPVRSARARQLLLYIPHPASPQIIQLLAVYVGPRVSVARLKTTALRGAQGLREVGVNCGGNPCNFFLRSKQHEEGDHLHPRRPGYSSS